MGRNFLVAEVTAQSYNDSSNRTIEPRSAQSLALGRGQADRRLLRGGHFRGRLAPHGRVGETNAGFQRPESRILMKSIELRRAGKKHQVSGMLPNSLGQHCKRLVLIAQTDVDVCESER